MKGTETIYDRPGQTCNRLWSYLDTVAKAIATGGTVRILFWDRELKHFSRLRKSPNVSFPFYHPALDGSLKWLRDSIFWVLGTKIVKKAFAALGEEKGFVRGWDRRDSHSWFPSVREKVLEVFRPDDSITREVEEAFAARRREGFFIVGIHVRRGDYRTWEEGRWFLSHNEYAEAMRRISSLHPEKKVCFFISTNEAIPDGAFEGLDIMETHFTTAVHDIYGLTLCDRIAGPLSTFSRWASFYGRVPLRFIGKDDCIGSDEEFSPIAHFYRFENGQCIPNLTDKVR